MHIFIIIFYENLLNMITTPPYIWHFTEVALFCRN